MLDNLWEREKQGSVKKTSGYFYGIRRRWLYGSFLVLLAFLLVALIVAAILTRGNLTAFLMVALLAVSIAVLIFITNARLLHTILRPIDGATQAAHRIREGSYGIMLSKLHEDEVGELIDAINDMSLQIKQAESLKTEFISSVSHELRTPLTAITGWGETLLYDETLTEDSRRGLEIILGEARRLSKLVEELLEFTRMEDGRFTLNVQQMSVAAELEETIFTYREHLRRDGIELTYEAYSGEIPPFSGDPERLRQVFYNILDNASKHGREGGKIQVKMDFTDGNIVVEMRDFGHGIPEDELEHVKMKFYKGSSKERGSGIGLAVCEEIIRYHDGILDIQNAPEGGVVVRVSLPV